MMDIRSGRATCWLVLLMFVGSSLSVPLKLFYPYGNAEGDNKLSRGDDVSSQEVQLVTPINFYSGFYTSVFVNSNGHLSFESEVPVYQPIMVMPLERDIRLIAAWFADVDLGVAGNVFYRETTEQSVLERAAADINGHFSQFPDFYPLSVFIATWDKVGAFQSAADKTNTFQIVIASDELSSFVILNYLNDGLQWRKGAGKFSVSGILDPPAQAGFDSGEGTLHLKLPGSGTDDVVKLATRSNVNIPGTWMYHIGNTKGSNPTDADLNTGSVTIFEPELDQQTCDTGASQCSSDARCEDYTTGFCCVCEKPKFGNGKNCIDENQPQRLNGKISGMINGVEFNDLDMHAFVVTKDGRAYTAISRVPDEISMQMMTLNTIGGIIGWMFAKIGGIGAKNGYMFTGGMLNRTADIRYQQGGEVRITQRYYGHNVLNNIRLETFINGTIPEMSSSERITVDDYSEEYRRVAQGKIRSTSDRTFRTNEIARRYTWDQVITFEECEHAPTDPNDRSTQRLSVTKNFVVYDPNDRVVRFAMSNAVSAMSGSDPCLEGGEQKCSEFADCIPTGNSYRCECRTGFVGDGNSCEDLDECSIDFVSACDVNAVCTNVPGSFRCTCNYGYAGDGRSCTRQLTLCGDDQCDENARCVYNDIEDRPMCECNSGYRDINGDGTVCRRPIEFRCNEVDICHENADCLYDDVKDEYYCACPEGFSGDGLFCESTSIETGCNCDPNAYCQTDPGTLLSRCICRPGYTGNGESCTRIRVSSECDNCHPNAECMFDQSSQTYRCRCLPGFHGNGTACEFLDCRDTDRCDENAACRQDQNGFYQCMCRPGYIGDGMRCEPEGCNVVNNCDVNAQCVPDPRDTRRYLCRCNQGYSGNGLVCIRRVIPCNEVNNCAENAQCLYDPSTTDYQCRCNRGYEGDGLRCTPRGIDCSQEENICDVNADCILNVDTFMCVCKQGYQGDGRRCQYMSDEMNYLLFTRGYSIHKVPYKQNGEMSDGTRVLYVPDELAIGVTSDCLEQTFYWTDVSNGRISRANLDGFEKEVVVAGFSSPEGIAIDWVARNMYVTDSGLDTISVLNLNGTIRKTLVSGEMRDPRAIVLDPHRGEMYWTDWYRSAPAIERANMDGSGRQAFITTELGLPNGLTLDTYTQTLCWGDAGVNKIECVRTDGVGRRVITEDAPYPFDVAMYGNTIYWSDWTMQGIPNVNVHDGEQSQPLSLPVGGNGRIYGIASVGEVCPRVTNACYRNNGGCRYLCLPSPNGGRTCACPDDIDDVTCSEIGTLRKK